MNQEQLQQSPEIRIAYQRRQNIKDARLNVVAHTDYDVGRSYDEQSKIFAEYAKPVEPVVSQVPESIGSTVVEIEANSTTEARQAVKDALIQEFGNAN